MTEPITATDLAQKIVDTARSFDGACACAPYQARMFEAVGMPFDTRPFHVIDGKVVGMSTCYVFALNVLRLSGVAIHTWHLGEPIGAMVAWAKRNDCWQPAGEVCPGPGDMLVIGSREGTHVAVVEDCDGSRLRTYDGGQVCRRKGDRHDGLGRQMVARREREWCGGSVVGVQRDSVVGWVDCGRVPLI